MHFDVHFWEAACFCAFMVLVYVYVKDPFLQYLDEYTAVIKNKIARADAVRDEAKRNLDHFQELDRSLNRKIKAIHKHTEENIKVIKKDALEKLAEKIKMREVMHKEKLEMYSLQESKQMQGEVINKAFSIAHAYLSNCAPATLKRSEINKLLESAKDRNVTIS